ncbi:GUN4 domain-containing protein [Aulosira sp. FACHB-113]|nr:GUN4 domain-containing protein [Aulosira sp. FACHB-113]
MQGNFNIEVAKNTKPEPPKNQDDLSSEKGVDYTKLRDLLAAGKWKEADYETYLVMLQAVGRKEKDWIRDEELLNFPCTDLRTIDRLWVKYSNGRFGFSVQKEIYLSVGGKPDGKFYEEAWKKFGEHVGWRVESFWISYTEVTYHTSAPDTIPVAIYTSRWDGGTGRGFSCLASRLVNCNV